VGNIVFLLWQLLICARVRMQINEKSFASFDDVAAVIVVRCFSRFAHWCCWLLGKIFLEDHGRRHEEKGWNLESQRSKS